MHMIQYGVEQNPLILFFSSIINKSVIYYDNGSILDKIEIPGKEETVEKMINRLYDFNWSKFVTKI